MSTVEVMICNECGCEEETDSENMVNCCANCDSEDVRYEDKKEVKV